MSQYKSCMVAAQGLLEHEVRLIKSILKHGCSRGEICYEWMETPAEAHVVLVNADSDEAIKAWQGVFHQNPSIVLVTVLTKALDKAPEYFLARPIAPAKVLSLLEKIFHEKLASVLEESIFQHVDESEQQLQDGDRRILKSRRVLVVDDSPTVRKQLELELGSVDIAVDSAETGEQGIEKLASNNYDVVFLDVVLPGADGYEVCKAIKKNPMTRNIPVVMLTSKSSSFDRVRGAMAGCSSYLTKPVDYEKFHKVLAEYLLHE